MTPQNIPDSDYPQFSLHSLSSFTGGAEWKLALAHDRATPMLFWITRGQGRVLLDGVLSGIGAHNAVYVPAGTLFALDLGRQSTAWVVTLPDGSGTCLPQTSNLLRIRETDAQSELTGLIEAARREMEHPRDFGHEALDAHAALLSIWLRREVTSLDRPMPKLNAAGRISQTFSRLLTDNYRTGMVMADYAAAMGITPTHLTRAVKSAAGKSAADVLTERQIHAARTLLQSTTFPAKNIALHLGFSSAAYFSRFVQRHTGKPPSKLRKPG